MDTRYDLKDRLIGENCPDFDTIQLNVLVSYGVLRPIGRQAALVLLRQLVGREQLQDLVFFTSVASIGLSN